MGSVRNLTPPTSTVSDSASSGILSISPSSSQCLESSREHIVSLMSAQDQRICIYSTCGYDVAVPMHVITPVLWSALLDTPHILYNIHIQYVALICEVKGGMNTNAGR